MKPHSVKNDFVAWEPLRSALTTSLDRQGRGSRTALANHIGITRQHLHTLLAGKTQYPNTIVFSRLVKWLETLDF